MVPQIQRSFGRPQTGQTSVIFIFLFNPFKIYSLYMIKYLYKSFLADVTATVIKQHKFILLVIIIVKL